LWAVAVHASKSGGEELVPHPQDWPWSSWSHYEKGETGLIRIDPLDEGKSSPSSAKQQSQKPHP
jgi:hypothetical protein